MPEINIHNLAFIIALKRYRRNSVLKRDARYKMAQRFGIHPTTFNKYLKECIDLGIVTRDIHGYKAIKFKEIIAKFYKQDKIVFNPRHQLLKKNRKILNVKEIIKELEDCFLCDNVYAPQAYQRKKKRELIRAANWTVSRGYSNRPDDKILKEALKMGLHRAKNKFEKVRYNAKIRTSARHVAAKLKISAPKANKILNNSVMFERHEIIQWYPGANQYNFDVLKLMFPNATIYPSILRDCIKVHFGSYIIYRRPYGHPLSM